MVCGAGQEGDGLLSRRAHQWDRRGLPPTRLPAAGENLKETLRDHTQVIWKDQIIQFGGGGLLHLSLQPFNLDPSLRSAIREPSRQCDTFTNSEPLSIRVTPTHLE